MSQYFPWVPEIRHLTEQKVEEVYQRYLNGEKSAVLKMRVQYSGGCPQLVEGAAANHQLRFDLPLLRVADVGASTRKAHPGLTS